MLFLARFFPLYYWLVRNGSNIIQKGSESDQTDEQDDDLFMDQESDLCSLIGSESTAGT